MRLLSSEKKRFVRVIIGNGETGAKNLIPPTKTISIEDISVEEIHKKILKMINDSDKKKEKND